MAEQELAGQQVDGPFSESVVSAVFALNELVEEGVDEVVSTGAPQAIAIYLIGDKTPRPENGLFSEKTLSVKPSDFKSKNRPKERWARMLALEISKLWMSVA